MNQYEPLLTPDGWSGDEKRFALRLAQRLEELYALCRRALRENETLRARVAALEKEAENAPV